MKEPNTKAMCCVIPHMWNVHEGQIHRKEVGAWLAGLGVRAEEGRVSPGV